VKWYNEHGIIQTAGERELIGESLILDTDVNTYEVTAMEDTELYSIQKDKFFSLIATEPNLMQQFLESLNKKYVLTTAEEV
jgi:CRP-like cAMP-binding protein